MKSKEEIFCLDFVQECGLWRGISNYERWVAKLGRWVAKLVPSLLATVALWVRIQTSLKNTKWATKPKEWSTHSSQSKKYPVIQRTSWLVLHGELIYEYPLVDCCVHRVNLFHCYTCICTVYTLKLYQLTHTHSQIVWETYFTHAIYCYTDNCKPTFLLAVGYLKVLLLGENQLESSAISYYNMQHLSYLYTIDLSRNQLTGFLR